MKIAVGSKNLAKVNAVTELILDYSLLSSAKVLSFGVSSGVSDQPKTMAETIQGAKNRAKAAYLSCKEEEKTEEKIFGVGIEGGIFLAPETRTGSMSICVAALYDSSIEDFHVGISSAFEQPEKVNKLIFEEGLEMSKAYLQAGFTEDIDSRKKEGAVGILTNGRVTRKKYAKQALTMALVAIENNY